jgi:hypothetical protein
VDRAPRVPALKLSIKRTQRRSKGTVVPPDVTTTTGLWKHPVPPELLSSTCLCKKAATESATASPDTGLSSRKLRMAALSVFADCSSMMSLWVRAQGIGLMCS